MGLRRAGTAIGKLHRFIAGTYQRRLYNRRLWNPLLPGLEAEIAHGLWRRAAESLHLPVARCGPLLTMGDAQGMCIRVMDHAVSIESVVAYYVCGDKVLTSTLLRDAGVSVPLGRSFSYAQADEAVRYALDMGRPCVTKPARGTGSSFGVSLDLKAEKEIRRGFASAALFCDEVMVEQYVPGNPYRFLVFRGKCLSVTRRDIAGIAGNGTDSIRALVESENSTRIRNYSWSPGQRVLMAIPTDPRAGETLARQGLSWDSVLEKGRGVAMYPQSEFQFGATYHEAMDEVHPRAIAAAELAARTTGAVLAGVDLLCPDPQSGEYCVNEVNTTPGIWLHYAMDRGGKDPLRSILVSELGAPAPDAALVAG
jgi:cyanophycin synthetase